MQTQTTEDKDIQTVLSGPTIAVQTVGGMDPDTAARIITRGFRRLLQYQRMVNFRLLQGYLFCRDYKVNEVSGALEIMSMHMIFNHIDNKCMHPASRSSTTSLANSLTLAFTISLTMCAYFQSRISTNSSGQASRQSSSRDRLSESILDVCSPSSTTTDLSRSKTSLSICAQRQRAAHHLLPAQNPKKRSSHLQSSNTEKDLWFKRMKSRFKQFLK